MAKGAEPWRQTPSAQSAARSRNEAADPGVSGQVPGGGRESEGDCHATGRRSEGASSQAGGRIGDLRTARTVSAGGTASNASRKRCADLDFWAVVATHSSEDLGVSRVSHRVNRRVASGGGVEPKDRVSARKSQVQIINVREKLRREKAWFGIPAICFPLPETCKIMPHRKAEIAGSPAELRTLEFEAPGYGKVEIAEHYGLSPSSVYRLYSENRQEASEM